MKRARAEGHGHGECRGPLSLEGLFDWPDFAVSRVLERAASLGLGDRFHEELVSLFGNVVVSTNYSGMGCAEMALPMLASALQRHGIPSAFHAHSACDNNTTCQALLLQRPEDQHVFADILDRIPREQRTRLLHLAEQGRALLERRCRDDLAAGGGLGHRAFRKQQIKRLGGKCCRAVCEELRRCGFGAALRNGVWCIRHKRNCCPVVTGSISSSASASASGGDVCGERAMPTPGAEAAVPPAAVLASLGDGAHDHIAVAAAPPAVPANLRACSAAANSVDDNAAAASAGHLPPTCKGDSEGGGAALSESSAAASPAGRHRVPREAAPAGPRASEDQDPRASEAYTEFPHGLRVEIAGSTCVSWSAMGSGLEWLHDSALPCLVWIHWIAFSLPHIFVHECTTHFDESVLRDVLSAAYVVTSFHTSPVDLGIPSRRSRKYTWAVRRDLFDTARGVAGGGGAPQLWHAPRPRPTPPSRAEYLALFQRPLEVDASVYFVASETLLRSAAEKMASARFLPTPDPELPVRWPSLLPAAQRVRLEGYRARLRGQHLLARVGERGDRGEGEGTATSSAIANLMQNPGMFGTVLAVAPALLKASYLYSLHLERPLLATEHSLVQGIPLAECLPPDSPARAFAPWTAPVHTFLSETEMRHLTGNGMHLSQVGVALLHALAFVAMERAASAIESGAGMGGGRVADAGAPSSTEGGAPAGSGGGAPCLKVRAGAVRSTSGENSQDAGTAACSVRHSPPNS